MLIYVNWDEKWLFNENDRDAWVRDRVIDLIHERDFVEDWAEGEGLDLDKIWDEVNWEPMEDFEETLSEAAEDLALNEFYETFEEFDVFD